MSFYDPIKMDGFQKVKYIYIYNLSQTPSMRAIHTFFSPFCLFLSPFSILTDLYYRPPSIQALEVRE